MAPEHVSVVSEYADVLQIGARNMQNYQLLQAVGDSGKPALLKRGMSATVEEFLLAAEYILDRGNPNVILCERGIRTYEDHTRFTLPLATVPYLNDKSHLPVVVDPSHGTGKSRLVVPMARAAVAAGADGLMIEVHDDPEHAVSDGAKPLRQTCSNSSCTNASASPSPWTGLCEYQLSISCSVVTGIWRPIKRWPRLSRAFVP